MNEIGSRKIFSAEIVNERREVILVKYSKPELVVMGESASAIQFTAKGDVHPIEGGMNPYVTQNAYEADE
jgi:hypothetical protein